MTSELVVWLDRVDPETAVAVGGSKMGRLSELHGIGVTVPRGFSVTVDAYRQHCAESGLDRRVAELMDGVDASRSEQVEEASRDIRAEFAKTPVHEALRTEIVAAYEELSDRCIEVNVPVAVRSSATGEDGADASFAGIFDTYLGMSGADQVVDAVRNCWGSLFTPRALAYRLERGIPHTRMPMGVGVIQLVHAQASGVAFSIHPVTGKTDRLVVESSFGWGEAIVQGLVTPDHVEVGKTDRRILRYDVSDKAVVSAFDFNTGHVVEMDMPQNLRQRRVLDDEEVGAVVDAVLAIEEHYGHPVDVEWVLGRHRRAGEPVSVVQTRPVTVRVAEEEAQPTPGWDPVAAATKYAFGNRR